MPDCLYINLYLPSLNGMFKNLHHTRTTHKFAFFPDHIIILAELIDQGSPINSVKIVPV